MNLLIIGYYKFEDGYLAYGDYFKNHFETVSFFPLIELIDRLDENSTKHSIEHLEDIISGSSINTSLYTDYLINTEVPKQIVIITHSILTLCKLNYIVDEITRLKSIYGFKLFLINWDPFLEKRDYQLLNDETANGCLIDKFDQCFCADTYYKNTYSNCQMFKVGYNKRFSYYTFNSDYICDVLFVGTNLYMDDIYPNKTITRKMVLDTIYADRNIKLHIYGNDEFKEFYPNAYKGTLKYVDCNKAFSNAKICLNISHYTDTDVGENDDVFYSDRVGQIFGCDSMMLANNDLKMNATKDVDYIYVTKIDDLMPKIYYYLHCKEYRLKMKKSAKLIKMNFEYEKIVNELCEKIVKF